MILVLCVDDKMGLSFGGKRQSRDGAVTEDMLALFPRLLAKEDSAVLFEGKKGVLFSSDPVSMAGEADAVFLEKGPLPEAGEIVLYRWNRRYPATEFLTLDLGNYRRTEHADFCGTSHDKITRERWVKKEI